VEVGVLIKQRLTELKLEQRDLAVAAQVTESYISQLLSRKKLPPAQAEPTFTRRSDDFSDCAQGSWRNWRSINATKD